MEKNYNITTETGYHARNRDEHPAENKITDGALEKRINDDDWYKYFDPCDLN